MYRGGFCFFSTFHYSWCTCLRKFINQFLHAPENNELSNLYLFIYFPLFYFELFYLFHRWQHPLAPLTVSCCNLAIHCSLGMGIPVHLNSNSGLQRWRNSWRYIHRLDLMSCDNLNGHTSNIRWPFIIFGNLFLLSNHGF